MKIFGLSTKGYQVNRDTCLRGHKFRRLSTHQILKTKLVRDLPVPFGAGFTLILSLRNSGENPKRKHNNLKQWGSSLRCNLSDHLDKLDGYRPRLTMIRIIFPSQELRQVNEYNPARLIHIDGFSHLFIPS